MKLSLAIVLAMAFGCATTSPQPPTRVAQNDDTRETKCYLIGELLDYGVHNPVRDETKTQGPSRVVWLNPPETTIIRTEEGFFYRCNGRL